jgi:hypothetical protein
VLADLHGNGDPTNGMVQLEFESPSASLVRLRPRQEKRAAFVASYVWVICNCHSFMPSSYVRDQPARLWHQLMYVIKVANFHLVALC